MTICAPTELNHTFFLLRHVICKSILFGNIQIFIYTIRVNKMKRINNGFVLAEVKRDHYSDQTVLTHAYIQYTILAIPLTLLLTCFTGLVLEH